MIGVGVVTKILVLARHALQCEEWRLSMKLPRSAVSDVITAGEVREFEVAPVLVRLPGWDMRPYREVSPVVAQLRAVDLHELPCNDEQAFASWREPTVAETIQRSGT